MPLHKTPTLIALRMPSKTDKEHYYFPLFLGKIGAGWEIVAEYFRAWPRLAGK
jgi:hypothetical protein